MTMKGGCLCGAVRYEVSGDAVFVGKCYCSDCQKEGGSGHLDLIGHRQEHVVVTGELCTYEKPGDSGLTVVRRFCPTCGTTVLGEPLGFPGVSMIRAGTLDECGDITMQMAIFCKSARDWDQPPAGLPQFEEAPQG